MIKVGITGCENLRAAELVRVLLNHPDVELKWVTNSSNEAVRLDHIVPGVIGETDLMVNADDGQDNRAVDVVFACGPRGRVSHELENLPPETRVVDLSGRHNLDHDTDKPWKYGLSEMQRRILVHETNLVTVPGNAAAACLLALMPMARNLLINNPVALKVSMGPLAFPCGDAQRPLTLDGLDAYQWAHEQQREVVLALSQCQSSFNQPVELTISRLEDRRALTAEASFKCGVDDEMIKQLYEQYYSDHNFVFMVDRPIATADVENTNKCLIHLSKDDTTGLLTIKATMDLLLKGCVGTAVHMMNLMFGLHERVGLSLKATGC